MATNNQKVLVLGSGGREHAIVWKLSKSPRVAHIYVAPGNAGMTTEKNVSIANISTADFTALGEWCVRNEINLVVIGPEDYLSQGIVDELTNHGISCFGPRRAAAQIEASKHFSKSFMDRHQIPSAKWRSFQKPKEAKIFIEETREFEPLVVKASGLAAGKGVIVATNRQEAAEAVDIISEAYEDASETIIVEEVLEGEEVSVLAFCDGINVEIMIPAQDHKRLRDGDVGPNTGGMGAYCPCPLLSDDDVEFVKEKIIRKTVHGMKSEGVRYIGVLYAGLMITKEGPKVLEFNCRFGDPETQVILPLLESDLYDIFEACTSGSLDTIDIKWISNTYSVGVVMASAGYPGSYLKGKEITNIGDVTKQPGHVVFHAGTKMQDGKLVNSGGRVLIAVALGQELAVAAAKSLKAVETIHFEGAQFRTDISKKGIARSLLMKGQMTYKGSGVDIDAGDSFVKNILALTNSTKREGCMGQIGSFGGFFDTKAAGYKDPYLVSGTDGVGTKVKISEAIGSYDTVGIDLVAMCVNDILAHAAEPLFFLDYFATGKLELSMSTQLIIGIAEGCRQAGCALIGGETAEMPGVYLPGTYDLAGFAVGAVERGKQLPYMDKIKAGDIVLGLPSSGPHSNGYSLIRRVVEKNDLKYTDPCPFSTENNLSLGEALLAPTKIYVKSVLPVLRSGKVKAFAHITGGGLSENIPRVLPKHLGVELDARKWPMPPVFGWIAGAGGVSETEMMRTFNCGLGGIMIISPTEQSHVMSMITDQNVCVIGRVKDLFGDESNVQVKNFADVMAPLMKPHTQLVGGLKAKKRVAVLISGSGTNLQAILDHTQDPNKGSMAEIALVISNKPGVQGLLRASNAGIATMVINHKDFPSREEFDNEMTKALEKAHIDLICLAGFMRILTGSFVRHWRGRLINIHPSLLPSFKGAHAHEDALKAGVCVTGCTVHFVEEDVDAGAIIAQETIPVHVGDTVEVLQERVKTVEHVTYPKALELLARNKVKLGDDGKLIWKL